MKRIFAWVAAARLPGEGMHPLSNPTHHRITHAALDVLDAPARDFLAPESDLLTWAYCGFPDLNWHWYGTFSQDPGIPENLRLPDVRREWEIPRICDWNSLTREGKWYPHWPPDTITATGVHLGRALRRCAQGHYHDAVRFLGACLHYAQDTGSPAHAAHVAPPLHLPMERLDMRDLQARIAIAPYTPTLLGRTPAEADAGVRERGNALYALALGAAGPIRDLCRAERQMDAQEIMLPCAQECARYSADILHTFCALAGYARPEPAEAPCGRELLHNADLHLADDVPEVPQGWYVHWNDLYDRGGSAARIEEDGRHVLAINNAPGAGIHWRTTWPASPWVRPGMPLRLSFTYGKEGAQGAVRACLRFYTGSTEPAGLACTGHLPPAASWTRRTLTAEVPANACRARVSLESAAFPGRALFREVSLQRVE